MQIFFPFFRLIRCH